MGLNKTTFEYLFTKDKCFKHKRQNTYLDIYNVVLIMFFSFKLRKNSGRKYEKYVVVIPGMRLLVIIDISFFFVFSLIIEGKF